MEIYKFNLANNIVRLPKLKYENQQSNILLIKFTTHYFLEEKID